MVSRACQAAQSGHKVVLEPLRAELARLGPAERASPAWQEFGGEKWKESGLVAHNRSPPPRWRRYVPSTILRSSSVMA